MEGVLPRSFPPSLHPLLLLLFRFLLSSLLYSTPLQSLLSFFFHFFKLAFPLPLSLVPLPVTHRAARSRNLIIITGSNN